MRLLRRLSFALGLAVPLSIATFPVLAQEVAPVAVELFTSQGCGACPPANEYFAEITARPGIVALSFHVDYWNYLGWVDPFSSKKATYRQKMYAMNLRQTGVYTPQIVVQGRRGEVGSDRTMVDGAIKEAQKAKRVVPVTLEQLGGARLRAVVGAAPEAKGAVIWLFLIDRRASTKILRGENEGRTLVHHNLVRDWRQIGQHTGERTEIAFTALGEKGEKRGGAAVLVQQPKGGPVLGAAITYVDHGTDASTPRNGVKEERR